MPRRCDSFFAFRLCSILQHIQAAIKKLIKVGTPTAIPIISPVLRLGPCGEVGELGASLVVVGEGALLVGGDVTVDDPAAELLTFVVGLDVLDGVVKLAELPVAGPFVGVLKKYTVVASAAQT